MANQVNYHSGAIKFELKAPNNVKVATYAKYVLTFATI